ncbi:adenylate/guanylate cyclase domain-containing protein, partial [Microbacteriaceae bacterium]|nr:adenylate/guanylate cyclase domain-containing protein [Candidatus Saccharibacteria bacterium]
MSHKNNFDVVKEILKDNYETATGSAIPKKDDLPFANKLKKIENAVVVYLDMRGSRKIMFEQNEYRSLKTHRAFLQSFISCIDNRNGKFRSFNGDGALAFFHGEYASSRAVKAAMEFDFYVQEMNKILTRKDMLNIDYGIGIAKGTIFVAKTGKKGAGSTRQDLIWVGKPTYMAVELSDMGRGSHHTWISKEVYNLIVANDASSNYRVYTDNDGDDMWRQEQIKLS